MSKRLKNTRLQNEKIGTSNESQYIENVVGLFSLKWVNRRYGGYCIRLRRVSDSSLMDFGWNENGDVDIDAIIAWAGASPVNVRIWYDQSGLGNDKIQPSMGLQPLFDTTEVVVRNNGTNEDMYIVDNASIRLGADDFSIVAKVNPDPTTPSQVLVSTGRTGASGPAYKSAELIIVGSSGQSLIAIDDDVARKISQSSVQVWNQDVTLIGMRDGSNLRMYRNGNLDNTTPLTIPYGSLDPTPPIDLYVGSTAVPGSFFKGDWKELWIIKKALTTAEIALIGGYND